jgi:hypothetical protein
VHELRQEQAKTNAALEKTNLIVETYQKASTQVVNLAFGLIATATLSIIVSVIVKR